jgi:hypothetical protein
MVRDAYLTLAYLYRLLLFGASLDTARYKHASPLIDRSLKTPGPHICRIEIAAPQPDWDASLAEEGESSLPALPRVVGPCPGDGRLALRPQRSMPVTFCEKYEVWLMAAR